MVGDKDKIVIINGLKGRYTSLGAKKKRGIKDPYALIPLKWLDKLPPSSDNIKFISILWFLNGLNRGDWFRLKPKICKSNNISQRQKTRLLALLEKSGCIVVERQPGKAVRIKMIS